MSLLIYGGSLEFVTGEMLLSPFAPAQVFFMAVLIQARHLFYGLSMLDKFKGTGWKKFYLIFGMCDETFSVNYAAELPEDVDRGWFMFFVTLLNQIYWCASATCGAIIGSLFTFDTSGISCNPRYWRTAYLETPDVSLDCRRHDSLYASCTFYILKFIFYATLTPLQYNCYRIRVSKGEIQFFDCQIAQIWFCLVPLYENKKN